MGGILLALLVSLLKASSELAGKFLTGSKRKTQIDEYTLALTGRVFGAVLFFPIVLYTGFQSLTLGFASILLISAVLNALASYTSIKAVKDGELSVVGALGAFTLPFLLLTSYLILGETPSHWGYLGVLCIFLGTYFLGMSSKSCGIFGPIRSLSQDVGAKYMLLTTLLWSLTTPLDKLGILEYGALYWLWLQTLTIGGIFILHAAYSKKLSLSSFHNFGVIKKAGLLTAIAGIMLTLQYLALQLTLAVYVIAIKRASGIFSIAFGALFYKEKNILLKLIAVSIMTLGVFLIAVLG